MNTLKSSHLPPIGCLRIACSAVVPRRFALGTTFLRPPKRATRRREAKCLALVGLLCLGALMSRAGTHYVAQGGQTPVTNYTSWATAASNIQDAITVAANGETVLVSNGVYEVGGVTNWPSGTLLTNRVAITNAITVQAVSTNAADTTIKGHWDPATNGPTAVRCVYMANNSSLIGFTLTNGATLTTGTYRYGGGVFCQSTSATISNCVLTGNSALEGGGGADGGTLYNCTVIGNSAGWHGAGATRAKLYNCTISGNRGIAAGGVHGGSTLYNCTLTGNRASGGNGGGAHDNSTLSNCTLTGNWSAGDGGGAHGCTLRNCTLIGNEAVKYGGGAWAGTQYNCTVVGNEALYGGGVCSGAMYNCIVYFNNATNEASTDANWYGAVSFTNCCTTPSNDVWASGNITNDPMFLANGSGYGTNHVAGNYHLTNGSPCINTGTNQGWMTGATDLDGHRRLDSLFGLVDMGAYEHTFKGTFVSMW